MLKRYLVACVAMLSLAAVTRTAFANNLSLSKDGNQVVTDTENVQLAIPAGKGVSTAASRTVVESYDSQIVFESLGDTKFRALIKIDRPGAPERYDFEIRGATQLKLLPDGSVFAFDSTGAVVATIEKPWAKDANGKAVPTRFEINRTTVTQIVNHRAGDFAYTITADPTCEYHWHYLQVNLTRRETRRLREDVLSGNSSAIGAFVGGAATALFGQWWAAIPAGFIGGVFTEEISRELRRRVRGQCLHIRIQLVHPLHQYFDVELALRRC